MKFLSFIRTSEAYRDQPMPPEMHEAMGRYIEKSLAEGVLVDTGGLAPTKHGFRLSIRKGQMKVVDGPFTEAKEVIGGWAILEAKDYDHAVRIAKEFMQLHIDHWPDFEGESEVRPIEFKLKP